MTTGPLTPEAPAAPRRTLPIYLTIIIGALVISLDFASVDLALPAMEAQFGLDLASVQWVINGYVLAFAVCMVTGGKLADAYGRKLLFLIGLGTFTLASLLGGAVGSGGALIACRVWQGVGAALLWPSMIGMACAAVGEKQQAFALGLIFGSCSIGNAAGPIVGGALTEWFSWRWVLWVNVPMALLAVGATLLFVPWDRLAKVGKPKNDFAGMFTLTFGLVALMLSVYQVQDWGWRDPRVLGLIGLAIVLLGAFPFIEKRSDAPLIPLELMRSKEFCTLCFCVLVICQLFFVVLLYFTQYGMKFLNDDPISAGARVVQFMLAYGLFSYFGGPILSIFGARKMLLAGLGSAVLAATLLGIYGPGGNWVIFNSLMIVLGMGVGLVIPTVNARAIESAGTERAGLVSGVTFMVQLSGSALMLAVNTALFSAIGLATFLRLTAQENITLTAPEQSLAEDVLTGASTIHALPAHTAADLDGLANIVTLAFQSGLQWVMWLGAVLVIAAFLLVWRYVPAIKAEASDSSKGAVKVS